MEQTTLSLRQRKLLHYLQQQDTYTTGKHLASELHVTARTIRSDVQEINHSLLESGIQILSRHGQGYLLDADDKIALKSVNRVNSSFLTRDERARHIAFRLCLAPDPIDLYDLEEEMFISHTTLEQDLRILRKKYILPAPHIQFFREKNTIWMEKNERKRRFILCRLFSENWDYNNRGNTYYNYQYLEENVVNQIIQETTMHLARNQVLVDDVNIVILELMIAVFYYRDREGYPISDEDMPVEHVVPSSLPLISGDIYTEVIMNSLLDSLENILHCQFDSYERKDLCSLLGSSRLLDAGQLNFESVYRYFPQETIQIAQDYLRAIKDTFHIDLSVYEDFYITLLQYLQYLTQPDHALNTISDASNIAQANYLVEFEIAFCFQPFALQYYGSYLNYDELLYLAYTISGGLACLNQESSKIRTVLMCHLNLTATWNLKQQILSKYANYISLEALLPMYVKNDYNFTGIDLVVTTTSKAVSVSDEIDTVMISPFFTAADEDLIQASIAKIQTSRLFGSSTPSIPELMSEAYWHEHIQSDNYLGILESLAMDFTQDGIVPASYIQDLLRRESILSFAFQSGILLAYSLTPSARTCLSIGILEHRIRWNNTKIRAVIMAAFRPDQVTTVFRLMNEIYNRPHSEEPSSILSKEDLIRFLTT